jgi:hypothetical protein
MTDLRVSQFGSIAVGSPPVAVGLRASQLASIAVGSPPAAIGMRASQLAVIAVIANGQTFQPLGPVVGLGCWTPCGNLAWNGE